MIAYEDFQPSHLDEVMALCRAEGWSSFEHKEFPGFRLYPGRSRELS